MNRVETPNLDFALELGMGGSFLGFCLAIHFLLSHFSVSPSLSLEHLLIVSVLGTLITFGTIVFGVYYLILTSLLKVFRIDGDPFWVVFALPSAAFVMSFLALHGFWQIWLWL